MRRLRDRSPNRLRQRPCPAESPRRNRDTRRNSFRPAFRRHDRGARLRRGCGARSGGRDRRRRSRRWCSRGQRRAWTAPARARTQGIRSEWRGRGHAQDRLSSPPGPRAARIERPLRNPAAQCPSPSRGHPPLRPPSRAGWTNPRPPRCPRTSPGRRLRRDRRSRRKRPQGRGRVSGVAEAQRAAAAASRRSRSSARAWLAAATGDPSMRGCEVSSD